MITHNQHNKAVQQLAEKTILPPVPHRHWLKRLMYRYLRNDMVARLRLQGATWTSINRVLRAMGQYEVKEAQGNGKSVRIVFFSRKDFKPKGLPDFKHTPEPPSSTTQK